MEPFLIISSLIAALANVAQGVSQSVDQRKMLNESRQYNSMINQVQQYKDAGLNPNMAAGGFVPMNTNVSNVESSATNAYKAIASSMRDIMGVYGKDEQRDISRQNADTNRANAETNRIKAFLENERVKILQKQAKQALRAGDLDYAMKLLDYDYNKQTLPFRIGMSKSKANILSNQSIMSDYEAKTYEDYRDAVIDDVTSRAARNTFLNGRDAQKLYHDFLMDKANLRLKSQQLLENRLYRNALLDIRNQHESTYQDYIDMQEADDQRDFITHIIEKGVDIGLTIASKGRKKPRLRKVSPKQY